MLSLTTKNYNNLFDELFNTFNSVSSLKPSYDYSNINYELSDDGNELNLSFDVPGFSKSDLTIEVLDSHMSINGEVGSRTFSKRFRLSNSWDLSKANATVTNGVLDITVPKLEEKRKKTIEIKVK
jgi:HSP20 family protein